MAIDPSLRKFLSETEHLPACLKDFHDQKRLFKRVDEMVQADIEQNGFEAKLAFEGYNWRLAHIFTIDKFLWFMAAHGYTLQKSRKKGVKFCDLEREMAAFEERQNKAFAEFLKTIDKPEESK
jgi:hypothetical protein